MIKKFPVADKLARSGQAGDSGLEELDHEMNLGLELWWGKGSKCSWGQLSQG